MKYIYKIQRISFRMPWMALLALSWQILCCLTFVTILLMRLLLTFEL